MYHLRTFRASLRASIFGPRRPYEAGRFASRYEPIACLHHDKAVHPDATLAVRQQHYKRSVLGDPKNWERNPSTKSLAVRKLGDLEAPGEFWLDQAVNGGLRWFTEPTVGVRTTNKAFEEGRGEFYPYQWFPDGEINIAFNCIDRHVQGGRGDSTAIIYDSPVTGVKEKWTYNRLLDETVRLVSVLKSHGVHRGDRVLIYFPMTPYALASMLACARLGAVHSVVFGGFAAKELSVRIDDAKPKVIIAASCGLEGMDKIVPYKPILDEAIELSAHTPSSCLMYQREQSLANLSSSSRVNFVDMARAMDTAIVTEEDRQCTPVPSTHPLYILYTSGTTGDPKGIVRDHGGYATSLLYSMSHIYGVEPGEVYWTASDVGWVVGHSYCVYAPLLNGNATIVYEGKPIGTPDAGAFWRVISEHSAVGLFTAPTAFRGIRKMDPNGELVKKYDISSLRGLFMAGERLDPATIVWAEKHLKCPVIDHWWQTETGWPIASTPLDTEYIRGSTGIPLPGFDVRILEKKYDDDESAVSEEMETYLETHQSPPVFQQKYAMDTNREVPCGELGAVCIRLPLPPGALTTLYNNEKRFESAYLSDFQGYYYTGDAGFIDENGFVHIMSRVDDIINVAGHRLSTGAMEEVLTRNPNVAECAVIGIEDELKGQLPVGFVVLNAGCTKSPSEVIEEVIHDVRHTIGPVAAFKTAAVVERLPKTRSGKILRGTMKKLADGHALVRVPSTIDDPEVLEEIKVTLSDLGFPKAK